MTGKQMMTDLEIQEQAKYKYPQFRDNNSTDSVLIEGFIEGAKWMQEQDWWISVENRLPKSLQTVWLSNGNGFICLGCLVDNDDGWHWAESNGIIYIDNGEITSECESEDLDVVYWKPLPSPPKTK